MIVHQAQGASWIESLKTIKDGRVALTRSHVTDIKGHNGWFCHNILNSFFYEKRCVREN